MAGWVHVPWYATGFRGDQLQAELERVTPLATRYGATHYVVFRGLEDRYRFLQAIEFEDHLDWDRFWDGPEMVDFRTYCQGWYQVPVLYSWNSLVSMGEAVSHGAAGAAHGDGRP